jgi:hypothetical protein
MASMPEAPVSPAEYIQTLKHSSIPTVITEGSDDYFVFRRVEDHFRAIGVSLLPVGGKHTVLEIFKNRDQFSQIKTAFIVDRDIWLFAGVPGQFDNQLVIVTDGYSIENDLYRDGDMEALLLETEKRDFSSDLKELLKWYSFAVYRCLSGHEVVLNYHPNQILGDGGQIKESFGATGYIAPNEEVYKTIFAEYSRYLRGKTLMSLLVKYLSHRERAIKHSRKSLMELACVRRGQYMARIYSSLQEIIG